jgi:hypothetical protein
MGKAHVTMGRSSRHDLGDRMSYAVPRAFKSAAATVIGFLLLPANAFALSADEIADTQLPSCEHVKDAAVVQSLRDLPSALRRDILTRRPLLADRGQAFSAGCIRGPGESPQRFIVAARIGSRWVVAFEQGGIAHSAFIMAFDQQTADRYEIVSLRSSNIQEYCAEMNARLRNEPVPNDQFNWPTSYKNALESESDAAQ